MFVERDSKRENEREQEREQEDGLKRRFDFNSYAPTQSLQADFAVFDS
jgi:hypothetical protein